MNRKGIIAIVVCLLMGLSFSYGQNSLSEPKYMEFHDLFFTGLKEKGIGNYKKALYSFEKAYEIHPTDAGTLFELSKVQALLLAYDEAEYFAGLFLEKEPENVFVLDHLARLFTKQYRYTEAIEIREKIMINSPKQVDALILLYMKNKEKEKALKLIERAEDNAYATLRTVSLKKYLLRNSVVSNQNKVHATRSPGVNNLVDLRATVKKEGSYKACLDLLKFEEKTGLFKSLLEDASAGLELYPAQAQLYLFKGIALNKLEKFNLAIETLMIGVDFVIENPKLESNFYRQLALSYGKLNQVRQAKKFTEKSLKLSKKG